MLPLLQDFLLAVLGRELVAEKHDRPFWFVRDSSGFRA